MANDKDIPKYYDFDETLDRQVAKLTEYIEISLITGEISILACTKCQGPLIGHIKCILEEKTLQWNEQQVKQIVDTIHMNGCFTNNCAKLDSRQSVCICDSCNLKFRSRWETETHLSVVHNSVRSNQQRFKTPPIPKGFNPTQIVEKLNPPNYGPNMKFENFIKTLREWNKDSKDSDLAKFNRVADDLSKNKDRQAEYKFYQLNETDFNENKNIEAVAKNFSHKERKWKQQ